MKTLHIRTSAVIGLLAAVLLFSACATGTHSVAQERQARITAAHAQIKPLVEKLYLGAKALEEIYHDLRVVAQAYALMGDQEQLDYLQKAALYIQKSAMQAHNQWEILSLMEDIRPEALGDYHTLRAKALRDVIAEARYDERLLKVYRQFIQPLANPARQPEIAL
jgi:hypothetical protein